MIGCSNCGSAEFNFILAENYKFFFESCKINVKNLLQNKSNDFSNALAKVIIDKTEFFRKNKVLEKVDFRSNVFKQIICKNCNTALHYDALNPSFTSIYYLLYDTINEDILRFLSKKSRIKIDNFAFPIEGPELYYNLIQLVKRIDDKKFNYYSETEKIFSCFSPQIGGPSSDLLNNMLFLLGFNIFCNFVYDLIKFGSKKVRKKYTNEKIFEEIRESLDSQLEKITNPPPWIPLKDKMNVNLYGIIVTMPEKKKEQILDDIALQHAINVKNELLELMA